MKSRWHIGWILFALVMFWGECIGDIPKILHRTTLLHWLMALANATAVLGLVFYAFRWNSTRGFWRMYAPIYALIMAAGFGVGLPKFTKVVVGLAGMGTGAPLILIGAMTVILPVLAMVVFTIIALFRLGDWIGPTRRPVGERQLQFSLPL